MKKITLLLLAAFPMLGFSQTFDFTGVDGGWTGVQSTLTQNATSVTLDFVVDQDPKLRHTAAGVTDPVTNGIVAITLKNNSSVSEFRFVYEDLETGTGTSGVVVSISPNTNYFKTYVVDLSTDTAWDNNGSGGTQNAIDIAFREPGGTNGSNSIDTDGSIEIDKVEFISTKPEKTLYDFNNDGDVEGWSSLNDATTTVSGGVLSITPTAVGTAIAKVTNSNFSIDASTNTHMHIVYKNLSADNNQLRIQFRSSEDNYVAFVGTNETINTSMSNFETLSVDLASAKTEWTGNVTDIQLAIRNTGNTGNASSAGDIQIDQIIFDNNETLSSENIEDADFSLYPNPVSDVLNITGNSTITAIEVYNITGQKVLTSASKNQINVSQLSLGVYVLKLQNENNQVLSKKFIKK
ncbi:T9SS type A sorting domain-containing protein [Wenyingzhuangia sp. IMCC45467]